MCVRLNSSVLALHVLAMLIVGTKNKIREVIARQENCMNITSPFDSEFSFSLALSSKHRCSSVGVTEEGTELVTWKLYSV